MAQTPPITAARERPDLGRAKLAGVSVLLILIWGTAYTLVGLGVRRLEPIWLVAGRTGVAAVLMLAVLRLSGRRLPSFRDPRWLWYGALGQTGITVPFWLLSVGQVRVDSGLAAILVGSMPILTVVLAHLFGDERLTPRRLLGFVVGFAGIVILFLPGDLGLGLVGEWRHQLLLVGAAGLYAATTVAARGAPETESLTGATLMVVSAAATAGVWALASGLPANPQPPWIGLVVGALGVGSTAVGTILYLRVVDGAGAGAVAKINYFPPVVSVLAGVAFLGEPFTWRVVAAFAVIMLGVWMSRGGREKATEIERSCP